MSGGKIYSIEGNSGDRWRRRHHFTMERDWLIFCTGVVPAISSMVRRLTAPNENVLVQTPVYNIFFNSIVNNGCRVLESPLRYDGTAYSVDFDDLEAKLADPQTTLMILCNPHNSVGKIWDRETLAKIGALSRKKISSHEYRLSPFVCGGRTATSESGHCSI